MRIAINAAIIQILLVGISVLFVTVNVRSQNEPAVTPSRTIYKIRQKMKDSPSISSKDLLEYANGLLREKGYDYTFSWEPKGKENQKNILKIGETALPFSYLFVDADGKTRRTIRFLNSDFGHPCFSTIDIPITRVTENRVSFKTAEKVVDVRRPKDFYLEEIVLVDVRSRKPIRKWMVPIDAMPVGISGDGMKIYFDSWEFHQNQYEDYKEQPIGLGVELSANGTLRFVDIKDIPSDKGTDVDHDKKYSEITFRKYKIAGKEYLVRFSYPCT